MPKEACSTRFLSSERMMVSMIAPVASFIVTTGNSQIP
jgi:hypothetical protein